MRLQAMLTKLALLACPLLPCARALLHNLPSLISLSPEATPIERLAASEVSRILLLVSAGNLSSQHIVPPTAAAGKSHFAVGYVASVAAGMSAPALATLDEDSFVISTAANLSGTIAPAGSVALSGCADSARGSLYAVYELFRALGVKFLGEDAIVLPAAGRITNLPPLEVRFVPSFEMRSIGSWANMNSAMWSASLGLNGGTRAQGANRYGYWNASAGSSLVTPVQKVFFSSSATAFRMLDNLNGSNWRTGFPPEIYAAHPDWFSNGAKFKGDPKAGAAACVAPGPGCNLCWSSPSLVSFLAKQVKMFLRADSTINTVTVSNMDVAAKCETAPELAMVAEEDSDAGPMFRATNTLAAAIASEFPHVMMNFLAYSYCTDPVKTKALGNVAVQIAFNTDGAVPITDPINRNSSQLIAGWNAVSSRIYMWGYQANFCNAIMPNPRWGTLSPNLRCWPRSMTTVWHPP